MAKTNQSRYSTYAALHRQHRGKPFHDLVNSKKWKNFLVEDLAKLKYKIAIVPAQMEFRADLISFSVYGTVNLWWVICSANAIIDPTTELVAGKQIRIPII